MESGFDSIPLSEVLFEDGNIRVVRCGGLTELEIGGPDTVYSSHDPDNLFPQGYWNILCVLSYLAGEVDDVLMVGLGGGTVVRQFKELHNPRIEVVEVDERMIDIAKKFFGFREHENVKVHVGRGEYYIKSTTKKYDIILFDVFDGDLLPEEFTGEELYRIASERLSFDGVLLVNLSSPLLYSCR